MRQLQKPNYMQFKSNEFDPAQHDRFKCLTLKQPFASMMATGEKTIDIRHKDISYRGDVLISAAKYPILDANPSGCSVCLVELYDVKPVYDLTEAELRQTGYPESEWEHLYGYAYFFRNPRPVIEFPVAGKLGMFNLVYSKGCIMPYPKPTEPVSNYEHLKQSQAILRENTAEIMQQEKIGYAVFGAIVLFAAAIIYGLIMYFS